MEYSKEFKDLLLSSKENLIGWGNPNAEILIVACEPATPLMMTDNIKREIEKNREQWIENTSPSNRLEDWLQSFKREDNPCQNLEFGYITVR